MGRIDRSYVERMVSKSCEPLQEMLKECGISIDMAALKSMSLYDCCEEMLRIYNSGNFENNYAIRFLNVVAEYSAQHRQDLREFLEWMDDHLPKIKVASSGGGDAVSMMTIHTAKGLQWKVVIVLMPSGKGMTDPVWVDVEEPSLELKVGLVMPSGGKNDGEKTLFDAQLEEEKKLSDMDDTNTLYVALTRAEEKLIVYATTSGEKTEQQQMLKAFLKKDGTDQNEFEFGEDHEKMEEQKDEEKVEHVELESVSTASYATRIIYAQHANEDQSVSKEREFGTTVHDTLALVSNAEDVDGAVERQARKLKIDDEEKERIRQTVRKAVEGEESGKFFRKGDRSLRERALIYKKEELRPDRIVFAGGETWVVDFKTGEAIGDHHKQVGKYCEALKAMGYEKVRGYLLYMREDDCEVVEVGC